MTPDYSHVFCRKIPVFQGYYATPSGQIFSSNKKATMATAKTIALHASPTGYVNAVLYKNKVRLNKLVHRVVLETFEGECPAGCECSHVDGDTSNNHINNLKWETKSQNNSRKESHGTSLGGERHPLAKLTEMEVAEIRSRVRSGENRKIVALDYPVGKGTINEVVRGHTWKKVPL